MKKLKSIQSLLEINPILSKEWHPSKNGDLHPGNVSPHSNKKVWWKCNKGDDHEWEAPISNRSKGRGCPVCSGRKVVLSNCLASTHPELAKQWHPTKNGDLTPFDIGKGNDLKVWWKCDKGIDHEWQAQTQPRAKRNIGCPICSGHKVVLSNCLATIHPELAAQWHPTKNGDLTPFDVYSGSSKRVWWKCNEADDHEWLASVSTRQKSGCNMCAGKTLVKSNCLATINPELAAQWHPTKNGDLTPFDVHSGSNKRVWWKCNEADDHEWQNTINSRAYHNTDCPMCAKRIIVKSNCLATTHPELAQQWHPTKNRNKTPFNVGGAQKNHFWWICEYNKSHVWKASLDSRVGLRETGCPDCAEHGFNPSKPGYFYLREIILKNKRAIKFGITNQLGDERFDAQKRSLCSYISFETVFRTDVENGHIVLAIENEIKNKISKTGYLLKEEMSDGYTETIKYSKKKLDLIMSIVNTYIIK